MRNPLQGTFFGLFSRRLALVKRNLTYLLKHASSEKLLLGQKSEFQCVVIALMRAFSDESIDAKIR
jgi:hypothetical protein